MSEMELHVGKLKRVDLSTYDNDIEKFFEEQYRKTFTELTEQEIQDAYQRAVDYKYRDNYRENCGPWEYLFQDNCDDYDIGYKYYAVNGIVYETIEEEELDPYDDFSKLKDNGDGTYDYIMTFYNGGTYLRECIEGELEKLS
jgi:hypothetical protein